jgi:hypothetical protein
MKTTVNFWVLLRTLFLTGVSLTGTGTIAARTPIVAETVVFAEVDGLVAVEAEHFSLQTAADIRAFHLTTAEATPDVVPDGDPTHVDGASGGAYLELLPDTRRTHADKLTQGVNFAPAAGKMAILHYQVHFKTPGRYYVWVRAFSTGSEDNGLHVGIDGTWPESGQRLQWCDGKHQWFWESKQRTKSHHCGEAHGIFLDVEEAGEHTIQFSMREDGFEFDKWLMTTDRNFARPHGAGPASRLHRGTVPEPFSAEVSPHATGVTNVTKPVSKLNRIEPRQPDGQGGVEIVGEQKRWHKITLQMDGPFAHEQDNSPNPFTDYRMQVEFQHEDGTSYLVPGHFAADGNAAESSAASGTMWRAHFAPDRIGNWSYRVSFQHGKQVALDADVDAVALAPFDGVAGKVRVDPSDKSGRDLRAHGRLQYVGKHYLQFAGTKRYFLKFGADAPETLLAYTDFDNTIAGKPQAVPLKSWQPHVQDWRAEDPTWQGGKGKGLIGAINYLAGKGCNAFSFLTYNAGGDGDNVWPFIHRDDKRHYDCSKLDQWATIFEHGTTQGMYLHFKLQETEIDDHRRQNVADASVPEALDGGELGPQRKLYLRELISRFAHNLALNWNLGEENTQSVEQQRAMIDYIAQIDPYHHHIVVHTYPQQQDKVYRPLLGSSSRLTGASLQNNGIAETHRQTVAWVRASAAAGKPWVIAFDESGSAEHAQCPDLGYRGFDGHDLSGKMAHTQHEVRKQTLWGTLMAGGAGCEYYFGYRFVENDLLCEDWRSRDQSWDYGRIAIRFFHDHKIPFWEMENVDPLVGNPDHGNSKYCFAKPNDTYLVYLPSGGATNLDLTAATGEFAVWWFNPRTGGELQQGSVKRLAGGSDVSIGNSGDDSGQDWLALIQRDPRP